MLTIGIDIGKNSHFFAGVDGATGEIVIRPTCFKNDTSGFDFLIDQINRLPVKPDLIGMEDTGHYHLNLLQFLLQKNFKVALINPTSTDMARKMQGSITKNDKTDTLLICDMLLSSSRKKPYRIIQLEDDELTEAKYLTRHHHDLKEERNTYTNKLQQCIDRVFPEFNSLFKSKYGIVYMRILKTFASASNIAHANIRSLRQCFAAQKKGRPISLTPEQLKEAARKSVGTHSDAMVLKIKHLIARIELVDEQLSEIDKKIEEFSEKINSPILSIPGISHFSGTSIIAELGNIGKYSKPSKIIKFAGVAPKEYESSEYKAQHTAISKKGSKYLRKTLYQDIFPVIQNNPVFKAYYNLKISQGKGHLCALGHCVRKLMRVIYHLLSTGTYFDPDLLR